MIQKEIQKILKDEVADTSTLLCNDWKIVASNFNGYKQDGEEWANQIKDGFYSLSHTNMIDDSSVSLSQYYSYVEKIWGEIIDNYERLFQKYGSHQIVASNRIPDFPNIILEISRKNRPESEIAKKILEKTGILLRKVSDKDKVLEKLKDVAKQNEGFLSVNRDLATISSNFLEISDMIFDRELDDFAGIDLPRKIVKPVLESIARPRVTVEDAVSTIRFMYEVLRNIEHVLK